MYTVEVDLDNELFFKLWEAYSRSRITGFENYLESISSRVAYIPNKGYTILFEDEYERTLFYLKWS